MTIEASLLNSRSSDDSTGAKYRVVDILGTGEKFPKSFALGLFNMNVHILDASILTADNGGNAKESSSLRRYFYGRQG